MTPADLPGAAATLASFLLGYAAILATPGPNMLAVGGVAALRGLAGALPFCLGIAAGAGALAATLLALAAGATGGLAEWHGACRGLGGLLLAYVAVSVARSMPPVTRAPVARAHLAGGAAAFGAGFLTAATNPLTAAFFAAQFIGQPGAAADRATVALALAGIILLALGFFLGVAALFAHPLVRQAACDWHRPIRLGAAAALALMAAAALLSSLG